MDRHNNNYRHFLYIVTPELLSKSRAPTTRKEESYNGTEDDCNGDWDTVYSYSTCNLASLSSGVSLYIHFHVFMCKIIQTWIVQSTHSHFFAHRTKQHPQYEDGCEVTWFQTFNLTSRIVTCSIPAAFL